MSAKKKARILGPDGKPYVAPPKPETKPAAADGGGVIPYRAFVNNWDVTAASFSRLFGLELQRPANLVPSTDLRAAVARQVEELTADFDGESVEELPQQPRDLTAYRDAFASAAAKCNHRDAVEVMFGRQWICDDCHRSLGREEMRKSGWSRFGL